MEPRTATVTVKQEEQRNASSSRETLDEILEFNLKTASTRVTHVELELTNLLHCYSKLEAEYKQCQRELRNVEEAIEIKNADLSRAHSEIYVLQGHLTHMEGDYNLCQTKLKDILANISCLNKRAIDGVRTKYHAHIQEASSYIRLQKLEEEINLLELKSENEIKIRKTIEAIQRYENNLEIADARAQRSEMKALQLQEEMRLAETKLKSFEKSLEKARLAEIEYKKTIKDLQIGIHKAESRANKGKQSIQRLHDEIDNLTAELKREEERLQSITFEMEETLSDFS